MYCFFLLHHLKLLLDFFLFPSRVVGFLVTKHPTYHFTLFNMQTLVYYSDSIIYMVNITDFIRVTTKICFSSFLGKYCGLGLQMNHSIESKSNEITVLFMSGIHVSGRGFLASYSVIEKQGNFHFIPWLLHFIFPKNKNEIFL